MKNTKQKLRTLTLCAMMAALSIVFERIITITPATNMMDIRISLSNVPIILAGILTFPAAGAVCGVVSDVVGCFISGYAPFPILTLAPLVMGFLPAFLLKLFKKKNSPFSFWKVGVSITLTHLLSSFLITTAGLCIMRGTYFLPMLVTRLPSCILNLFIDLFPVYLLLKTPIVNKYNAE